jgi:hypothetical protein
MPKGKLIYKGDGPNEKLGKYSTIKYSHKGRIAQPEQQCRIRRATPMVNAPNSALEVACNGRSAAVLLSSSP